MKNIKRILSFALCVAMLFSCCLVQAEETTEVIEVCGMEELGLVSALGICEYLSEDLYKEMTKVEFYEFAAKLGGYPAAPVGLPVFADLAPGAEGECYARLLKKLNIIAPDANGNIYPDNPITPVEAASIIVKLLGYSPLAETKGGYPAGYLATAASLKITECVNMSKATLTRGEAVEMAYAALESDFMIKNMAANDDNAEYKIVTDTTYMEATFGVELIEGIVNGVDITRVFGDNDVRPFYIEVDEREIYIEDLYMENLTEPYDYLGYDVRVYAKEQRGYGTTALYIEKTEENEEYIFDIEDISSISSTSLDAYEPNGSKVKTYRFKKAIPLVYNGIATSLALNEDLIEGKTGTIRLVDNTGDRVADVAFAQIYENVIASYVDLANLVVYDETDSSTKINIDNEADDPYVMIFDANGEEIGASKINKGNILSVYESAFDAQQAFSKIYVSNVTVSGEIEAVEDKDEVIVNGKLYEISADCLEKNSNFVKVGTSVIMYLDVNGKVAYIEAAKGLEYEMGFIAAAGTETGIDGRLKFKICTAPETYVEAYAAKNIRIDDIRYSNTDSEIYDHLNKAAKIMFPSPADPETNSSMVRFALNSNGEISVIDTLLHDKNTVATRYSYLTDKNCFYAVHQDSAYHRRSGSHLTLGNGVVLNKDTQLFAYPDLTDDEISVFDEDMYSRATFTSEVPTNKTLHDVWAFYTSREQIVSTFVAQPYTKKVGGSDDENAYFAIVSRKTTKLDTQNDDAPITNLVLMTNNGEVNIPVNKEIKFMGLPIPQDGEAAKDPELVGTTDADPAPGMTTKLTVDDLKQGDIIRYAVDYKGYLSEVIFYYRPTTDTVVTTSGYFGAVTSVINWYKGYVYDTYPEGFFFYTSKDLTGNIEADREILEKVTMEDCQFVYYTAYTTSASAGVDFSKHNDALRVGAKSMANLKSYVETGDDCTYGVLQRYYTYPRMFIALEGLNK